MLKKFVPFVLGACLSTHVYAASAVYGVFSSDDPNIMTASHDGDSMTSDCPSPQYGEADTICTLIFKNNAGKTYAVKGLNADQISNAGIYWFPDHQAELVINPVQSNDLYNLIVYFNTFQIQYFKNVFAIAPQNDLLMLCDSKDASKLIVTHISDTSTGLLVGSSATLQTSDLCGVLNIESHFDHQGNLVLKYFNAASTGTSLNTLIIPINPSQFVPINPSDIGTFDIKTLNANSGHS